MSRNKQKNHVDRKAARAEAEKKREEAYRRNAKQVERIRLTNWLYVFLTGVIILVGIAVMIVFEKLNWFDGFFGAVLSVLIAGFTVMCIFDEALLLTACITVADGQVNAGKNEKGDMMIFHTENINRIELRDKDGNVIPEAKKRYNRVCITFVMHSGRINQRPSGYVTQSALNRLRDVCKTSKAPEKAE